MKRYLYCLICKKLQSGELISLTSGRVIHKKCHDVLLERQAKHADLINSYMAKIAALRQEIQNSSSLAYKIKHLLGFVEPQRISILEAEVLELEAKLIQQKILKTKIKKRMAAFYDYWPHYPPDWEDRKLDAKDGIDSCAICHSASRQLHVHHKFPISRGGNHTLENLEILCERCHEMMHGGRKFTSDNAYDVGKNKFIKKFEVLRSASINRGIVQFHYTRRDGVKSVRSVKPKNFTRIEGSLCVNGYCFLRKEDRTFAIKRIKRLMIVNSPKESYFVP